MFFRYIALLALLNFDMPLPFHTNISIRAIALGFIPFYAFLQSSLNQAMSALTNFGLSR